MSGAQGLTRLGFPLWSVQLLGRWCSDTVKAYVGTAALDIFSENVPEHVPQVSLDLSAVAELPQDAPTTDRPPVAPPLTRDEIERLVAQRAGDLRSELLDALVAEVRLQLLRRAVPARSTVDQAASTCEPLVRNSRTKCLHVCAIAPESGRPQAEWTSLCGWDFGLWGGFTLEGGPTSRVTCECCAKFSGLRCIDASS